MPVKGCCWLTGSVWLRPPHPKWHRLDTAHRAFSAVEQQNNQWTDDRHTAPQPHRVPNIKPHKTKILKHECALNLALLLLLLLLLKLFIRLSVLKSTRRKNKQTDGQTPLVSWRWKWNLLRESGNQLLPAVLLLLTVNCGTVELWGSVKRFTLN